MNVVRATCPNCAASFVHQGRPIEQIRADTVRAICQTCKVTMTLAEVPATNVPERTALNWERVEKGLTGTQIQKSEDLLVSVFGPRAGQ